MLMIKKTAVITVQQQTRPTHRPRPPLQGERSTRHARRYVTNMTYFRPQVPLMINPIILDSTN